jgi:hypothetical protein
MAKLNYIFGEHEKSESNLNWCVFKSLGIGRRVGNDFVSTWCD